MESWIGKIDGGKFINLKPYFEGVELKDIKNFFTKDDIIACVPSQRRALAIAFYNYIHDNYQSIKSSFIVSQPEFKAIPLTNIVKGLGKAILF